MTLADNGTLTFGSADAVTLNSTNGYGTTQIVVGSGGLLSASGAAFAAAAGSDITQVVVSAGGHLQATNSSFALGQVNLNVGAVLGAGDLVGDGFDSPLYLPAVDVQYLSGAGSNNLRFKDIDIQPDTLTGGQSVALNAIGTQTTTNLRYVLPGSFTINQGATLAVAANVPVLIGPSAAYSGTVTLADNGTLTFGSADAVTLNSTNGYGTTQIVVGSGGLLSASGAAFAAAAGSDITQVVVSAGGHLQATNSSFALGQVNLNVGAVLGAGDLVGDGFDSPLYLPAVDVQYLSGAGSNNLRFKDIDIQPDTLTGGQSVALNAIGTQTTTNLRYVLPGSFTINQGATLAVAANVPVLIGPSAAYSGTVTLADNGTLTFGSADAVTLNSTNGYGTTQIVVGSGGLLSASGAAFAAAAGSDITQVVVSAGGHLQATNSSFALGQVNLNVGAVLGAGDLVGDGFDSPLYLPAVDVQYLSGAGSNNLRFKDIDIQPDTLTGGQSVALNAIGTQTTTNLRYVLPGSFTINQGATLAVAANVPVLIGPSAAYSGTVTLADNGTLTFGSADAVTLNSTNGYGTTQIVVGSGGLLSASGAAFAAAAGSDITQVVVSGQLAASHSTFALTTVTLNSASTGTLQFDTFSSQIAINSGASLTIDHNDLSNVPGGNNGIIATGNPSATIDLTNNYWGTTVAAQIAAKIKDHVTDTTRPTVTYTPFLSGQAAQTTAAPASTTFKTTAQNVTLNATVTSAAGNVNQGTETFTILNGATALGSPVTVNVSSSGVATATYSLVAGTIAGTYTIQAVYNGTSNYTAFTDTSHSLTVGASAAASTASAASGTYNSGSQNVALSAGVTSSAGTVNEGTETFTLLRGTTPIGSPVTVNVASGSASATYALPPGTAGGSYTIQAVYNGTANFAGSTDNGHSLTVGAAASNTAAASASATYSAATQTVTVSASVTSGAGTVNEGTETFTILSGTTVIGSSVNVNVASGGAAASYVLPANTAPGTYTIQAAYNGTSNFQSSTDTGHALTINAAPQAAVTVGLDSGSNSGAPNHPGFTNTTAPQFDVNVNQAGTITIDFDGNAAHDQALFVSAAGTYSFAAPTLADGAYTATATFAAGSSGTPQNTARYTIDTAPPRVVALAPGGTANDRVSQAQVTFSEPVDLSHFSPSTITLTGPGGTIAVNQPQLVSGSTYSISFPTQTAQAAYSLVIAASVPDFAGNAMGRSYSGSFAIALPDLAVTNASTPSSAVEGVGFSVGWEVANVSAANPTAGAWHDAVYVGSNPVLDDTAIRIASVAGPTTPLAVGTNYSRSASVAIPGNLASGNYYLLFVANTDNGQLEADAGNDTNDLFAEPIAVTAPDLQVTGVSGPATGITGQTVLLNWTDTNSGTAPATGPWVDKVYTSTDAHGADPTLAGSFTFEGNLDAGASVQRTQQIVLPQASGTRWFTVVTNATQTVAEGANSNGDTTVSANPIAIAAPPLPDLVVTGITPPPNGVLSGNSVPISFVVENAGAAPTSAAVWQDWVILSQDATLGQSYQGQLNGTGTGGDQLLNNQPIIVGFDNPSYLGVGESYQQNVNVPLPINAQGTWYVYVVPDGTGGHHSFAMPEASRTDKLAISSSFSVTLSPPPDLAVTNVRAPAQDFSGQPIEVSWTITNTGQGATAAGAWTDAVYMSPTATLGTNATLLGTFPHQGALAGGANYANSQPVTLPVGVSGSFYYIVETDLNGQVFENGATANDVAATSAAETVNLTPPPDLKVTAISAPTTGVAGHGLTFSYTVTNAGAGATPNFTWNDSLYLSPTPTFDANSAIWLGQQTHQGSLAPAAAYSNTVTATLPNGLVGTYYVVVATDTGTTVFELNRTNNTAASASPTRVSMAPADLVVSAASAPATALPGSAILVNWTITNQSSGDTAGSAWQDSVYVDTGSTRSGNAVLLGTFARHGLLAGGDSYAESQLVTLPIDLLGSYHLFVVANSSGAVYESNAGNNSSAPLPLAVSLQVTGPDGNTRHAAVADLEVTAVTASSVTNGGVTVHWTVRNNGSGITNANYWDDDIWMSTKATLGSGGTDVYLGAAQHTNPLAAGGGYSTAGTFTVPQSLPASDYYFIATTNRPVAPPNDPDNEGVRLVYESNATNNAMATSSAAPAAPAVLADLAVTNVGAATLATSGGRLAVNWTVTNNGANTGNVPITDSVYLSYDRVVDSTDRYLGSVTTSGGLANGASITRNANLTLPAGFAGTFYVIVKTNSDRFVLEQNTTDDSAAAPQTVRVQLSPPADLVAGTIATPANALAGQNITITYQVTNNGSNPANGSWTDALYLSPTQTWNVSDPLLGQVYQVQNLAPGGSYTGTLTAPLPGVAPGTYYVILRSNILATFPEPTLSNNLSASLQRSSINAPALALGTPASVTLNQGQSAYYKVVASAGQTLQVALAGQNSASHNELYVSYGTMPTRSRYDFRYGQPFQANQLVTVPTTQAGAYYILAYGDDVPTAPETVTLEATIVPFSIRTVAPARVGAGPVTLQLSGAQFAFSTTFQLRNGSGASIDATRSLLQDSATAFATFDLTGKALGAYDVWATQSDGTSTELAAGLDVAAAAPNSVRVALIVPQAVLVGRPGTVTITYSNPGNTDLAAPLILLGGDDVQFQVPGQTCYTGPSLQLYGFNPAGPFGTLQPGFQGSITVSFKPITAAAGDASTFRLETLQNPSEPFDWGALAANDVPSNTSPQQWAAMVSKAQPSMGGTWGDVVSFIGTNGVQLVKNIGPRADPSALNTLYDFDALLQYAVGVYGTTSPSPTTPSFSVVASNDEVTLYNAHVDGSGNALPLDPSYPTFVIVPGLTGYRADYATLAAAIAADTSRFPGGHVNILIATWQGAADGPAIDGVDGPWTAALHVDADGAELGNLLTALNQQGAIALSTTTVVGEGLGNDVGNQAAKIAGGLGNILALNPASALSGYLPSTLAAYFQHSSAYETSSFLDTQSSLAVANQALDTGDINDPIVQHTFGVSWLTRELLGGNDGVLSPGTTAASAGLSLCGESPPPSAPTGLVVSTAKVVQIISHDPNSIIGPKGAGPSGLVPTTQPLPYTIQFANTPTVPAPAQMIVVREDIDPSNLDPGTFRLSSFGFDGQTFAIPTNTAFYQTTIPLRNHPGDEVQFTATIDESTGRATWTFVTIDIATGQVPLDPSVGLLAGTGAAPASTTNYSSTSDNNDYGFVSYTILPTENAPTGAVITARAAIVFDNQSPMNTNEISNTVDAGTGLSSSVATLPVFTTSPLIPVTWSGSDASGGSGISAYTIAVSDNGAPYKVLLQNTSLTAAPFIGQDGHTYSFTSVAMDNAGNVLPMPSTAQASTEVDATPPTTTGFDLPGPGGTSSPSQWTGTISGSASDGTSGVAQEQVSILDTATGKFWDGSTFSSSTEVFLTTTLANPGATSTTWSLPFSSGSFPADGSYTVHAVATDEAGNVATAGSSRTFSYDSAPPTTTDQLRGTTGTGGWFRSAVTVALSAGDATSGVAATYYTVDGGSRQAYAGSPFAVSGDGSHHIAFWSVDAAGNAEGTEADSFAIDSTPPVATDRVTGTQGGNGWYTSTSVSVTLNSSDATSGVAATYYTVDGGSRQAYAGSPFAVSGDGSHRIAFWSVDAAGNAEGAEADSFAIDSTPPVTTDRVTGTQGNNGWYTSASVAVALSAGDATSGVAATYYTVDGGSRQAYAGSPFAVSGDGAHRIAFWSVDAAGNVEASEADTVNIDTVNPATTDRVTGTQGNNGWYTSASVAVALSAGDATSGVAATYYTVDGGGRQAYAGSPFAVSGDGAHRIAFWSVDAAGNVEASEADTVNIDTVNPATTDRVTGTQGNNGWYTSASVAVALSAGDATSGVAATYYTVDGGGRQAYAGSPFAVSGNGSHQVAFWSVDVAGNVESSESDSFVIDSAPPVTTDHLSGTQGNNGWYTSSVTMSLTATDANAGGVATYYTVDGGAKQSYSGPFTVSGDAIHSVLYYSVDVAGNSEAAKTQKISIDTTAPVLHLPANQVVTATRFGGWVGTYSGATATDNLTSPTVTYGTASGTLFPLGTTSVLVTATDAAGNQSQAPFTVTVVAARANHLVIRTPAQLSENGSFTVAVAAGDSFGNLDLTYNNSVALSLATAPLGGQLAGIKTAAVVNGVATFTGLSLNLPGNTYQLLASGSGVASALSGPITVAPTTHFSITGAPPGSTAGVSFTVTVTALDSASHTDSSYLGTIHLTSSDPQAVFSGGDVTFTAANIGKATFTVTLATAGAETIAATDITSSTIKGSSTPVTVAAAAASRLSVSGYPTPDIAGVAHPATVTALDRFGNRAAGFRDTVVLGNAGGSATLPAAYAFTAADNGSHAFSVTLNSLGGGQSLTAGDGSNAAVAAGTQPGITVLSSATHLAAAGPPAGPTAGVPFAVALSALSASNGPDLLFPDVLHFSSSDPNAVLPPDQAFSGAAGREVFTVTLDTAGGQTVTVTDLTRPSIPGVSTPVTVSAAAASRLSVSGYPTPDIAGVAHPATVTALDRFGNRAAGFRDTVVLGNAGGSATLPAAYAFTAADNGSHAFSVTLNSLGGGQSLTAGDGSNAAVAAGTQPGITVLSSATHLAAAGPPAGPTAGVPFAVALSALSASNGPDLLFPDVLHFSSSDPNAVLPPDQAFSGAAGREVFTVTLDTAGGQTVTVTDLTRPSIPGVSTPVTVSAAAASRLSVSGYPTPDIAGVAHPATVTALDRFGNRAAGFRDTVVLGNAGGSATLPAAYAFTAADNGSHIFSGVTEQTAGTSTLTATDTAHGSISGSQGGIAVASLTTGIAGPSLGVPGQPLLYTLTAAETNAPTSTVFAYQIDWDGNGTIDQTVSGASGLQVSHVFPATGHDSPKLTALDPSQNVSPLAGTLASSVTIQTVALEPDPQNSSNTVLAVGAPAGGGTIVITPADATGQTVSVSLNGVVQPGGPFAPTGTAPLLLVFSQGGTNTIQETAKTFGTQSAKVSIPAILHGGSGANTLSAAGSSANNVLIGGVGSSTLTGGSGRDILIGGGGGAKLYAGSGDDILISGSTAYDENESALLALMAEWGSQGSYEDRTQHLLGLLSGGLNGAYLLNAQTVFRDTALSQLVGGAGADWFWLTVSRTPSDLLSGYANGELVTSE